MRKLLLVVVFALLATSLAIAHPPQPAVKLQAQPTVKVQNINNAPRITNVQEFPGTPERRITQVVPGTPGKRITTMEEDLPPPLAVEELSFVPLSAPRTFVYPQYAPATYVMPATYMMPAAYIPFNFVPANAAVADYRTGVFGLKRNVHTADGNVIHYGTFGRPRRYGK